MRSVVTLCDKYYGKVTKKEIKDDPTLRISYNTLMWQIISYEYSYSLNGIASWRVVNDNKLPDNLLLKLDSLTNRFLYVDEIKAVNKIQDTIFLNSIKVKVID